MEEERHTYRYRLYVGAGLEGAKMLAVARRHFVQTAGACLFVSAIPKAASAQWPLKIILELIKNLPSVVIIA